MKPALPGCDPLDPHTRSRAVEQPIGIVIRNGAPDHKPVRFWAYLWADDQDETPGDEHWHQRVPRERAD